MSLAKRANVVAKRATSYGRGGDNTNYASYLRVL